MLQNRKEQESIEKMISFLCSRNLFHEVFNQRSFKRMTEEKDSQKEEKEGRESVLHEWKEEKLLVMNGRKKICWSSMEGREAVGHEWRERREAVGHEWKEGREAVGHEWREGRESVVHEWKEEKLLVMNGGKEEKLLVMNGKKKSCWS
jgi:hypothetical protein